MYYIIIISGVEDTVFESGNIFFETFHHLKISKVFTYYLNCHTVVHLGKIGYNNLFTLGAVLALRAPLQGVGGAGGGG